MNSSGDYQRAEAFSTGMIESNLRLCARLFGLAALAGGLWAVWQLFREVQFRLRDPGTFGAMLREWVTAIDGPHMTVQHQGVEVSLAPFVVVLTLGGATFLLGWLAISLMVTGAKIIYWTSSEREAVKRILEHTLGPGGRMPRN